MDSQLYQKFFLLIMDSQLFRKSIYLNFTPLKTHQREPFNWENSLVLPSNARAEKKMIIQTVSHRLTEKSLFWFSLGATSPSQYTSHYLNKCHPYLQLQQSSPTNICTTSKANRNSYFHDIQSKASKQSFSMRETTKNSGPRMDENPQQSKSSVRALKTPKKYLLLKGNLKQTIYSYIRK